MDGNVSAQIQKQLDVVRGILESTIDDRKTVSTATDALATLDAELKLTLEGFNTKIHQSLNAVAVGSAEKAGQLLAENFEKADAAALAAEKRYLEAAKRVGVKMFGYAALCLLLTFGVISVALYFLIPSRLEIEARRQELSTLESSIKVLKSKGALLQVTTCTLDGHAEPCVRTDERDPLNVWGKGDITYRLIWSK
ncbi:MULTISPECIES: hypothetical protein [unclassified Pseudomonas]|uniref:hypothetical protein n=1 Tax=unclassified Pseudomonas TaxID=196821 RepID=UPI000A1E5E0D|nr:MULTISPECIES: hypothetical protein [unclassified Pseudomonas]